MSQPPEGGQGPQDGQPPQGQGGSGPQGRPQQGGLPPQPGHPGPQGYPQQPPYGPRPQGYPQQAPYGPGPQGYPQQPPYAAGPRPQQPYPGPYPPGPYQPGPYAPGQNPAGPGPAKKRTGLFVLIGAGALALVLAVVAVAVNLGGREDSAGGTGGSGGSSTSGAPAAASASDAVTGYLNAVAKGDAAAAVAYAADPSTIDTTYMTPAVLAASAKLAPLTAIEVGPSDPDATSVPVSYRLGDTPVSTSLEVMKASDDTWKLVSVASDVDLTSARDDGVPMLLNGAKLKAGTFSVLPGVYRVTSGLRNFDYGKRPELVVRYPTDYPDTTRVAPQISSKGQQSALAAIKKSWSSCLDKHAQKPKGCPNQFVYKDFNFKDSTVRWSRRGSDPFKKIKPQYSDATTVQYAVKRDLFLKGTCTAGGRTGTCTGTLKGGNVQVEARLSGDKIKVAWLV
ncbi:hypothetical protein GCM10022197_35790 [Microlunatus spumicola]|uniref:Uncharacterized protein n=1 Tax=Microlunatus spumicola TaxID=81499 RepID=A0ABP6Y0W4_9ACTN